MKNSKRILSVVIKRMLDESPDTSWLGEYSNHATSEFSIDRNHDSDCPRFWANDDIPDDARECDCSPVGSRQLDYFNPPAGNYKGEPNADIRKYCVQDYKRMESLNNGDWCFIGIRADAEIGVSGTGDDLGMYHTQRVTSGGLWGIESDSDREYLASVEKEELSDLKARLLALGFSKRAIATAFKTVERKES